MVQIKNVAVFGASGALGTPVFKALVDSGKFNLTVISREQSKATFPSSVKVIKVDYTSIEAVTSALNGQDAAVSTVGNDGFAGQTVLIDAAIAAGVKQFLPSEFGSDLNNPKSAALPVFAHKVAIRKYLEDKVAGGADITYTFVENSAFLDWGLEKGFILNWSGGKPEIYDGGDRKFSATSLESIGLAVVGVLSNYEETKNRNVYIEDIQVTQNQLLALAKKADPERKFETVNLNSGDIVQACYDALAEGDYSPGVFVGFLFGSIFGGKEYGQPFPKNDNKLLGVPGRTEEDIVEVFKGLFGKK